MSNQTRIFLEQQRCRLSWPFLRRAIHILAFCSWAVAAAAQTNVPSNDPLLDLLVKKGFVTLEEAQQLRSESDALKTTKEAASFSKWRISDNIKSVELYGDGRMRC